MKSKHQEEFYHVTVFINIDYTPLYINKFSRSFYIERVAIYHFNELLFIYLKGRQLDLYSFPHAI